MSDDGAHKILFQLTGSIACFKACELLLAPAKRGIAVQTVASAGALRFVGAATLEGLTGRTPFTDLYEAGRTMDHIRLARWADVALLCPATANSLNRLAAGLADDAIGASVPRLGNPEEAVPHRPRHERDHVGPPGDAQRARAAHRFRREAPAGRRRTPPPAASRAKAASSRWMNSRSSFSAPWRRNDEAEGRRHVGRDARTHRQRPLHLEPEQRPHRGDDRRELAARGFQVTHLSGVDSVQAAGVARRETFTDHASLDTALRRLARDNTCAAVIHAAAVGDFAVADPTPDSKIQSGQELAVTLQPTPKIIERIMGYA